MTDLARVLQFRDRDRLCTMDPDITVAQCYGLKAVVDRGTSSVNQLASDLFVDKSTASRIARQLQDKGLVRKQSDSKDGRAVRLSATPEGAGASARIRGAMVQENIEVLRDFDPEVRHAMLRLASRLTRALSACCTPSSEGETP